MGNANRLMYPLMGKITRSVLVRETNVYVYSFGRGEAAVSIVLKPLDAALRDHDKVYATVRSLFPVYDLSLMPEAQILGTGINSSGSLAPVNAPVASAQQDAMVRAFKQAQRSPRDVDFIELHATGTRSPESPEL